MRPYCQPSEGLFTTLNLTCASSITNSELFTIGYHLEAQALVCFCLAKAICCVHLLCAYVQDGNNINNIMTVLPRDAHDNGVRQRLLSPTGEAQQGLQQGRQHRRAALRLQWTQAPCVVELSVSASKPGADQIAACRLALLVHRSTAGGGACGAGPQALPLGHPHAHHAPARTDSI